eukprot:TRINITY_DN24710_c0_g1_i1.p1 TRINITY_DN24710_c0_g1~~TRINITY_DN24710_c0_g1_i1.p1  ORF type:complete len:446 (+),score=86.28 TRINITY_DN24710_c0_g1_i1:93-1430(+)
MKQATALALCVLPFAVARKSVANGPFDMLALAAEKKDASACSSHVCSDGYHPKANYDNITGDATDANCCNPTCRRWTCTSGYKAHPEYASNIGASNAECCDKTCSLVTCREGTGVSASKANEAGVTEEACCTPTCRFHSCIGNWAQDLSKKDYASDKDEDCCQQSCLAVECKSELGLMHHPDRTDKAGTTTAFCCRKTCSYYAGQCPADTGLPKEKMKKLVSSTSTSGALAECCDAKCSGHTCAAGYTLTPVKSDEFVSKAVPGCCEKTCKAHDCSAGFVKVPANDNLTQPSDMTCCAPSCKFWACPSGYFNSTDSTKLSGVDRSHDNCCEKSCEGYSCSAGTTLRPSPSSIPRMGDDINAACCESTVCKELREERTPTSVQAGTSTAGLDCNDFSDPDQNCSSKYKLFNISGALTAVPCIMSNLSLCKMDDSRVVTECSDLGLD